MPKVHMRTTAAGPERILEAGKNYSLSAEVAKPFLDGGFAVHAQPGDKLERIPAQPDPGDVEVEVDEDDDE